MGRKGYREKTEGRKWMKASGKECVAGQRRRFAQTESVSPEEGQRRPESCELGPMDLVSWNFLRVEWPGPDCDRWAMHFYGIFFKISILLPCCASQLFCDCPDCLTWPLFNWPCSSLAIFMTVRSFYWWLFLRSNVRYSNLRKFFYSFPLFDEVEIGLPVSKFCSLCQIYELKVRSWVTKPNTWSARWLQVFVTQFQNLNWCVYCFKAC